MYKNFMAGKTDELTYNGMTWTEKPIFKKRAKKESVSKKNE